MDSDAIPSGVGAVAGVARPLPPDPELVDGLRAREEAAFVLILDCWTAGMLRVARSFVSTPESAAEVVQETRLAVIEGIDRFEGRSTLKTWVYRILVNTARRRGDRERRIMPMSSLGRTAGSRHDATSAADDNGPSVDPDRFQGAGELYPGHRRRLPAVWPLSERTPDQRFLDGELRACLQDALAGLPERQQLVITLRDVHGVPADEVCAVLDISPPNQRVLLHRARSAVRARLEVYVDGRP